MENSKSGAAPKGLEPAKAVNLEGLVQGSEASIVSRVLLKTAQGSVTLFCFDTGQALSEHTAPFNALVQVLQGSVELTVGGTPLTVKAGEIALMPAGIPHSVKAVETLKMLLTMLKT